MLNLIISLVVGFAVGALFALPFGGWGYGIVPGLIAAIVAFFLLTRRVLRDINATMAKLQTMAPPKNVAQRRRRVDESVALLQGLIEKWDKWQFFLEPQICGHIGMLLWADNRQEEAVPHLQKSSPRSWISKAYLGVHYYKKKRPVEMKAAFEEAVKYSPKESLLWNTYAWCLYKRQERDEALAVLNRAVEKLGAEERTERNRTAVQNSKGMKMKGWGDMWYQFQLETHPDMQPQQFGKRALYKGR